MAANSQLDFIWQDREIFFDCKPSQLNDRPGEKVIDSINSVEDTKGNNGERGALIITNLRIKWISHTNTKINLSKYWHDFSALYSLIHSCPGIGLSCIATLNIRKAKSKLRGPTQALCVLAKFNSKFEFVFTSLVKNSPRLFTTVQAVHRCKRCVSFNNYFANVQLVC